MKTQSMGFIQLIGQDDLFTACISHLLEESGFELCDYVKQVDDFQKVNRPFLEGITVILTGNEVYSGIIANIGKAYPKSSVIIMTDAPREICAHWQHVVCVENSVTVDGLVETIDKSQPVRPLAGC